jgi:transcriptional regulator with XRE-family HTH domain
MPAKVVQFVYRGRPPPEPIRLTGDADMTDWGSILRGIREEQGISQRQLAKIGRVNRNALQRFENNDPGATVFLAERLAKVLGYEFDICLKTKPLPGSKD